MKTCYIFGAGPIADYTLLRPELKPEDIVICADGGYRHAVAWGIEPQWLVGDFDSNRLPVSHPHVIQVKPEKDDTDMELAVGKGIQLGCREFVLYGALGGRLDHTMANIQMLAGLLAKGMKGVIRDEQNELFLMGAGSVTLQANSFPYLSLFSFSEQCQGVTLEGMKYPLTDYTLTNLSAGLGVSNEILGESARISFRAGTLLVIRSRDKI